MQSLQALRDRLVATVLGSEHAADLLLTALLARGHVLIEGPPGIGKTSLAHTLAGSIGGSFKRVQFTPDLLPSDITGTEVLHTEGGANTFRFEPGPIFANIVLADEINRAPAKTQSAMLEAMQENKVTVLGNTYTLQPPFFVLATQNPIEQEGTYPLPEAQLDRFMFLIEVDYPSADEEKRIAKETTGGVREALSRVMDGPRIMAFQQLVRRVPVPEHLYDHAVAMVRKTRPGQPEAPEWIRETVGWGAGPRAVQYLILGAKSRAALRGAYMASLEDLEAVASAVLNHRVITNFAAESQGMTSKKIVERLIKEMREE